MNTSPDLKNHPFHEPLQVPLAQPWFDETEVTAAADVVRSGYLCQGPKTAEFEAAFAKVVEVKHALAVASGSAGLLVALQAMGIGPGDEVIVPDMTFISTATAAMYLGARPVLCDIALSDYCIDPAKVGPLITAKTKAIIPVHYAGQTAEMAPLSDLAAEHGLLILEDAAEAHLARYKGGKFAGTIGDAGIFSFTPTKPMTTGEGGMIVTDNDELAEKIRLIRNFGDDSKFGWHTLGFNFRMNEVAAAIGLCQLVKLQEIIAVRRQKARHYDQALAAEDALIIPAVRGVEDSNYQLYTLMLRTERLGAGRDQILAELAQRGVSARLYYPALHPMGVFADLGPFDDGQFPNSIAFEKSALSLPIFTTLSREQQDYVIHSLLDIVRSHRK